MFELCVCPETESLLYPSGISDHWQRSDPSPCYQLLAQSQAREMLLARQLFLPRTPGAAPSPPVQPWPPHRSTFTLSPTQSGPPHTHTSTLIKPAQFSSPVTPCPTHTHTGNYLAFIMEEVQSTGNVLHHNAGLLLGEVSSPVDVSQN